MVDTLSLFLIIRDREKTLFHEKVKAVTSFNKFGIFDVLPMHAHFITIIKDKIVIHKEGQKDEEIKIDGGIMRVYDNNVDIFVGVFPHPQSSTPPSSNTPSQNPSQPK